MLVYPVTTAEQFGDSMADAADGRPLNRPLLSWMAMHAFEGQPDAATDPRINLLSWSDEQLALMPPTLVITDERDVLRSQGQEFGKKLHAAGVETSGSYFAGAMHEFFGACAVFELAEQAQLDAATHFLSGFGETAPLTAAAAAGGGSQTEAYPPGDGTITVAPASPAGSQQ